MSTKSQAKNSAKKAKKNQFVPVSDVPFTETEIVALDSMKELTGWNKKKAKDNFSLSNFRSIGDIENYLTGKTPVKRVVGKKKWIIDNSGSMTPTYPKPPTSTSELRLKFDRIRIEGNTLIIEIDSKLG